MQNEHQKQDSTKHTQTNTHLKKGRVLWHKPKNQLQKAGEHVDIPIGTNVGDRQTKIKLQAKQAQRLTPQRVERRVSVSRSKSKGGKRSKDHEVLDDCLRQINQHHEIFSLDRKRRTLSASNLVLKTVSPPRFYLPKQNQLECYSKLRTSSINDLKRKKSKHIESSCKASKERLMDPLELFGPDVSMDTYKLLGLGRPEPSHEEINQDGCSRNRADYSKKKRKVSLQDAESYDWQKYVNGLAVEIPKLHQNQESNNGSTSRIGYKRGSVANLGFSHIPETASKSTLETKTNISKDVSRSAIVSNIINAVCKFKSKGITTAIKESMRKKFGMTKQTTRSSHFGKYNSGIPRKMEYQAQLSQEQTHLTQETDNLLSRGTFYLSTQNLFFTKLEQTQQKKKLLSQNGHFLDTAQVNRIYHSHLIHVEASNKPVSQETVTSTSPNTNDSLTMLILNSDWNVTSPSQNQLLNQLLIKFRMIDFNISFQVGFCYSPKLLKDAELDEFIENISNFSVFHYLTLPRLRPQSNKNRLQSDSNQSLMSELMKTFQRIEDVEMLILTQFREALRQYYIQTHSYRYQLPEHTKANIDSFAKSILKNRSSTFSLIEKKDRTSMMARLSNNSPLPLINFTSAFRKIRTIYKHQNQGYLLLEGYIVNSDSNNKSINFKTISLGLSDKKENIRLHSAPLLGSRLKRLRPSDFESSALHEPGTHIMIWMVQELKTQGFRVTSGPGKSLIVKQEGLKRINACVEESWIVRTVQKNSSEGNFIEPQNRSVKESKLDHIPTVYQSCLEYGQNYEALRRADPINSSEQFSFRQNPDAFECRDHYHQAGNTRKKDEPISSQHNLIGEIIGQEHNKSSFKNYTISNVDQYVHKKQIHYSNEKSRYRILFDTSTYRQLFQDHRQFEYGFDPSKSISTINKKSQRFRCSSTLYQVSKKTVKSKSCSSQSQHILELRNKTQIVKERMMLTQMSYYNWQMDLFHLVLSIFIKSFQTSAQRSIFYTCRHPRQQLYIFSKIISKIRYRVEVAIYKDSSRESGQVIELWFLSHKIAAHRLILTRRVFDTCMKNFQRIYGFYYNPQIQNLPVQLELFLSGMMSTPSLTYRIISFRHPDIKPNNLSPSLTYSWTGRVLHKSSHKVGLHSFIVYNVYDDYISGNTYMFIYFQRTQRTFSRQIDPSEKFQSYAYLLSKTLDQVVADDLLSTAVGYIFNKNISKNHLSMKYNRNARRTGFVLENNLSSAENKEIASIKVVKQQLDDKFKQNLYKKVIVTETGNIYTLMVNVLEPKLSLRAENSDKTIMQIEIYKNKKLTYYRGSTQVHQLLKNIGFKPKDKKKASSFDLTIPAKIIGNYLETILHSYASFRRCIYYMNLYLYNCPIASIVSTGNSAPVTARFQNVMRDSKTSSISSSIKSNADRDSIRRNSHGPRISNNTSKRDQMNDGIVEQEEDSFACVFQRKRQRQSTVIQRSSTHSEQITTVSKEFVYNYFIGKGLRLEIYHSLDRKKLVLEVYEQNAPTKPLYRIRSTQFTKELEKLILRETSQNVKMLLLRRLCSVIKWQISIGHV